MRTFSQNDDYLIIVVAEMGFHKGGDACKKSIYSQLFFFTLFSPQFTPTLFLGCGAFPYISDIYIYNNLHVQVVRSL